MNARHLSMVLSLLLAACGTQPGEPQDNPSEDESVASSSPASSDSTNESTSATQAPTETRDSTATEARSADDDDVSDSDDATTPLTNEASDGEDSTSGDDDPNSTNDDVDDTPSVETDEGTSEVGASSAETTTEAATSETQPPLAGEPIEQELTSVPTARGEHGVGALNGEVYVLGGFTPTVTSSVQAYSPETETWRDVADFPVVFHHPNIASVDDQLYVLGFHAGSGQRQGDGSAYAYDPGADTWTALTSMPPGTERGASCVTTYQGKIYVFGGTNDVALPDASIYDPATDEWETLPFVPATRHHCVAAELNDKIYIVSGRDVVIEEVQAESYIFDPVAKTYTEVAPILTPRGGAAGGLLHGRIFVFGGEGNVDDPRGIFHEAEMYDPATDTWHALPDMKVPRHGLGGAVIGDRIYLPAGSLSQGIDVTDTFSVFTFE